MRATGPRPRCPGGETLKALAGREESAGQLPFVSRSWCRSQTSHASGKDDQGAHPISLRRDWCGPRKNATPGWRKGDRGNMNHKNPTPMIQPTGKKLCPVCGKPSYSLEGIHPQCAVEQADAPRRERLRTEKKRQSIAKNASPQKSWLRKCPKCRAQVHVRRRVCECGHNFDGP